MLPKLEVIEGKVERFMGYYKYGGNIIKTVSSNSPLNMVDQSINPRHLPPPNE